MLENSSCNFLCRSEIPGTTEEGEDGDGKFINELIQESYSMNWLIDGLPASRARIDPQTGEKFNSVGFELGSLDEAGEPVLNNHYDIFVDFHVLTNNPKRVFFFPPLLMVDGWERSISGCWSCCTTIE